MNRLISWRSRDFEPASDLFVFLEVFCSEGGIQAYVKDILQAYLNLKVGVGEVLVLRDQADDLNSLTGNLEGLRFYPLKTIPAWLGRSKLALKLLQALLIQRPKRVFCGHIKLAPLVYFLCRPFKTPYIVLTYGKEIWHPLPKVEKLALQKAQNIWTISRYSRDRACTANQLDPQKFHILPCTVDGSKFIPKTKIQF